MSDVTSCYTEWISVEDKIPTEQTEVVFYAKPFEWWTGMFTPKGKLRDEYVFKCRPHWGDDEYYIVKHVTHWLPLPQPKA